MELSRTIETETGEMIVKRVSVPLGLEELMEGLAKEVILKKPKDIYVFASEYFTKLLHLRDSGLYRGNVRSAKIAVKQPSKAVIVGRNIFSPSHPDHSSKKNIDKKPSTPYYLNHSDGSAKKTDEMRRSRIREHLRKKKEDVGQTGNTTETHSSFKKENSESSSKDMKLMHQSRLQTRNRRSISENKTKPEEKSYERSRSLREGTRLNSKNGNISLSIQKTNKNDISAKKTNSGDSERNSSTKKSSTNSSTDMAQKESAETSKSAPLPQNTELITSLATSIDSDNSNNKASNISSIQDKKGQYEVSYNPELIASDRENNRDSSSFLSSRKDSRVTENNETKDLTENNESVEKGYQKPHEEELDIAVPELKHKNGDDASDLIEHQDFPPVNDSSEIEAALTIQKLWRGFQSTKKTNDNQQNTSSTIVENGKRNCISQPVQKSQTSEKQTVTLEDENDQDINAESKEKKKDEICDIKSITVHTGEEDDQKKDIQNGELHCDNEGKDGMNKMKNEKEDSRMIESDTEEDVLIGESSDLDKGHEKEYKKAAEEAKENESSSCEQVPDSKETTINLDVSIENNVNKNEEVYDENDSLTKEIEKSPDEKTPEVESFNSSKLSNEEHEKPSFHQQAAEDLNTSTEIISEHENMSSENEGVYHTIVTDLNKAIKSSTLIQNDNTEVEDHLKPEEIEEPSSTLLNISQEDLSDKNSKNSLTNEAAIHDENKNEDNGMEQQTSTLCEKDSEGTLRTTSSDTVLSLDNTHGSYSMPGGSDQTEISNHSVIVNNTIDTSIITGLNSQVVNENNRVSTEHTEDGTKYDESPNGNEVIQSDEIDLHGTDVIETSNGEKACSIDDIGSGNRPDTESKNGDELLSTSSDNALTETEITKNNAISLEHAEEKSKEETEKDALKISTHIENCSSEGCDESSYDAENHVAPNQENASAPIESNKRENWNESTSKKDRDDADSTEYSKSIDQENPISTTDADHLNMSTDHEIEQQDYKSIKEFTNELNADKQNDIIDAQESLQSKEGHEQLATLSNSFHDAASDMNVSEDHGDNSVKNSEENRFLPAESTGHSEETILASTPELHELKEIENSDSSLCAKKEDNISDLISSNMPEETSNDTSNLVHEDSRVTISDETEDNANANEYQNAEKKDLSLDNSTKDHESSKSKEHQSHQQQEKNSLKTTVELQENECLPSNNSISESQIIDSQNIHDNKTNDMEKEGQKAVRKETGSTEPNEDITNDDISKVIQNNELEDELIIPETSSSQKDKQVDMKENDAENLSGSKKEISSGTEEPTVPSEIDADDKINSNHMERIISTRINEKKLPYTDKNLSNEADDNFRSLEEPTSFGSKGLQLHQINTEDSSKTAKKESKNRIVKKRPYSYRQDNEQQEKPKNNKTNIRRVKSQETTTFRNQNKARRNSVSPEKHLSRNVSKNSVNNAISREAVKEPLIIPKNIVPNGSIHDDMKSTVNDRSPKTDERIESEMTPTDSTEEKLQASNTQMETHNEINHSEEGEFIVEDTKGSMEKKSDNDVDDAISESYTRDHENHDHQLKPEQNDEFSKELNEKKENVVLKGMDDSGVEKTDVLIEEMQKDIQDTKEIIIKNDAPNTIAKENSDDRVIDVENKVENVLILKSNNADIQHADKMKELKVLTTASDSIELNNGKYSNLYPDEKGAPAEEHVFEKKNYNAIALAEQKTQDADGKFNYSEVETNKHHEKVGESGEEMTNKTEPGSIESEIKSNSIRKTEIAKEDLDQQKMNSTDIMSVSESFSDQDVDNKELNTSKLRTNSTDKSEKEIPTKNATDEEIIHSLIREGSSVNNVELNGENSETSNKDNGDHISQSNEFNGADLVDMNELEHNSEELTTTRNIHLAETDITEKQIGTVKNQSKNDGHISQPEMNEIISKSTNIEHPLENAMHEEKNSSQEFIDREKRDSIKTESISNCENFELQEPTENNDELKPMGTKNSQLTHMKAVDGGILRNEIIEDIHNHEEISHPLPYAKLSTESSSNMKTDSEKDVDEELPAIDPAHSMPIDESTQNSEESSEESGKLATRDDSLDSKKIIESAKEVDEQNVTQNSNRKDGKQGQKQYKKISPDDTTKNLDEIESAINIQKTWRGFQARKKVGNIIENNQKFVELQEKLFEKGETDENRNILNSQDKNLLDTSEPSTNSNNSTTNENNTKDKNLNDAGQDEITNAALKIQYSFRKFKTRKGRKFQRSALSHMNNDSAKEYVNQALKIQSAWRAYKVRKNIREVEEKINEIENNSGNKLPKSIHLTDEEILKAVTKIQTNLRGYMARKHFKNLLERNQSLDGIQEETNSESPNIKTNTTVSSDEDILNTLKQLDEVTIPSSPPEFVSVERIKRNVDHYADNECTGGNIMSSDSLNSSANNSPGNISLNEMNCSSTSVSEDTSTMNQNDILDSNKSDELSVNDSISISMKPSNNIHRHSNESFEERELDSKICDKNESDVQRPIPLNILDTDSSNHPKNTSDQQICNTEAQGSLKKSKATDDLVKLAEEFEYGEDSSKAIEHTLKTQKSLEENGSIQASNMEDYSLPDKKLASFEIPDSDVDLDDPSKVLLDHDSDSLHSEKSDTDEIDASDPKVTTANCDIENNDPPKTSLEEIKRLTKSVDEFQPNFHIVDDFGNQETTNRLEASPSKATDVRKSEKTEKNEPTQVLHVQKDNNLSISIEDNSLEMNCKKDFREDDGQINDSELEQFSLIDEKMPEEMSKNVENGDSLAQTKDGMKNTAISPSKSQEISEIDDLAAPTQSIKAVSVDQEKKENRSIDLSNEKQAENTEAIENNFIPPLELQTGETNNTNQQEEMISDNQSRKSNTFEKKESDKDNKQIVTGNQKNNRLTLNDFMKKTLNLDEKVPAEKEVTKDDLISNQKLPVEKRRTKNENAQIEIDLKDNDDSTEAFEKNTMSEHQAAVKIQSIYRGYNSRKNTNNITKVSDDSDVVTTEFLNEKNEDNNGQHSEQNSAIKESVSAQQTTECEGDFTRTDHPLHKNCTGDETLEKSSSVAVGIQTNVPPNTHSNTDEVQENVPGQVFVIIVSEFHEIVRFKHEITDGSDKCFRIY